MTKKQSKELRTNTIIRSAVEEFLEKGYSHASMDAIASRAGISKGGLYHHFRNKDEILVYATQYFSAPVVAMLSEMVSAGDAAEGLEKFISSYIQYWDNHRVELQFFFLSMNKAFGDFGLKQIYQDYFREELQLIEGVYSNGMKSGVFIPIDPKGYALSLISAIDGSLAYLLLDDQLRATDLINTFSYQFVRSILYENIRQSICQPVADILFRDGQFKKGL
jgi:AcrR family transcriptional regulator